MSWLSSFLGTAPQKTTATSTQTTTSGLDPNSQAYVDAMRSQALYSGQQAQSFATQGLTPAQMQAMQQMQSMQAPSFAGINIGAQQVQPGMIQGAQMQAPSQVGANGQYLQQLGAPQQVQYSGAGVPGVSAPSISAAQAALQQYKFDPYNPQSYQGYMNPFTQEVVDTMRPEFALQRDAAMSAAARQATADGAFGGSRAALLQGQAMGDVNRNEAATIAQLRSQGYQQAQQQAQGMYGLQNQLGLQSAGLFQEGNLANAGMRNQVGMANQAAGLQAGIANQNAGLEGSRLGLQAQLANQNAGLQTALANQAAGLQFAGLDLQGQLANQRAGLDVGSQNAQLAQQAALANQSTGLQGQLANQDAALRAQQLGVQQNLGLGGLGLQSYGMQQNALQSLFGMGEAQRQLQQQMSLDPYTRSMMALQAQQQGLGPYGQTTTSTGSSTNIQPGASPLGQLVGLGQTILGGFNIFGNKQPTQQPMGWQSGGIPSMYTPPPTGSVPTGTGYGYQLAPNLGLGGYYMAPDYQG